uniref:Cation/H+ exchanger domain-containing protein n=1 Tax=Kalanchoe fedtschenkoi TaxID=63787 RepID=A0A7N0V1L5_KALFE
MKLDENGFVVTDLAIREMTFCHDRLQISNGTATDDAYKSIWQYSGVLNQAFSSFLFYLVFVNITLRLFLILLKFKFLRQPRFVGELLAGILMGPAILGKLNQSIFHFIFNVKQFRILETVAGLALTYSMFLTGLETGFTSVRHASSKALYVGIAGVVVPFFVGCGICWLLDRRLNTGPLFWGAALSITSFPVVTRIIADLKLIHTEFGQLAMSTASVSDVASWVTISLSLGLSTGTHFSPWPLVSFVAFILVCVYGVRPALKKLLARFDAEGYVYNARHMQYVLLAVTVCSLLTDMIGLASFSGALVLGLVIPSGDFTAEIVERLGDVVDKVLLPLYFVEIGLRCNFEVFDQTSDSELLLIWSCISVACFVKIGSTILTAWFHGMTLKETLSIGVLLNTKGIVALVIMNEGFVRGVLSLKAFQSLVLAVGIMTAVVRPTISYVYRPSRSWMRHKRRSLLIDLNTDDYIDDDDEEEEDKELRILVCVLEMRSVPGLISIIELSNPPSESPMVVFLLHLVELLGNTATLLIIHNTDRKSSSNHKRRLKKSRQVAQSEQIVQAFREFEYETKGQLFIQPFTTMSPFATMDEDICGIAVDKKASLIIIPYHKHILEGGIKLEEEDKLLKQLNNRVLDHSPCSIGILVDRGLGSLPLLANLEGFPRRIACIFVSGPDDREALFYALRMAAHSKVKLDIVRLVSNDDSELERRMEIDDEEGGRGILDIIADYEKNKKLDIEFLKRFQDKITRGGNIGYFEICSNSSEGTMEILKEMAGKYELFVVGRGKRTIAPATVGMLEWAENPELGLLGDALLSTELAATSSLLVVQQYWEPEAVTTGVTLDEKVYDDRWMDVEKEEGEGRPKFMGPDQFFL